MTICNDSMAWKLHVILAVLVTFHCSTGTPEITAFEKVTEVNENSAVNVQLSTISCNDTTGGPVGVRIQRVNPISPCTNCFQVITCDPDYCLQYRAGVGTLVYTSVQSYLVRVVCEDGTGTSAFETIQVTVIPNTPPYFVPRFVDQPINAASTAAGAEIYTAVATDDDNDAITYSMQVIPSSASSGFAIDSNTGKITSSVDLRAVCVPHVTFLVTARDGRDSSQTLVINIEMTGANVGPVAMNLNTDVEIPEDATGTVYTMQFIDDVVPNTLTYTYTSTNADGLAQFSFIGTPPNIDVAGVLNYEDSSLRTTYLEVQATDGYCLSPSYYLRLKVKDVNEPPQIAPTTKTVSVCEGELEFNPELTVIDEDTTDTQRWSFATTFSNNNGRFAIDRDTGYLRTTLDYDVDQNAMPSTSTQIVVVEDKGKLTSTATVTVSYLDCNDNAPYFDGSLSQHSMTFYSTECAAGGVVLGTVVAKDLDSDREGNNEITYMGSAGCCSADTQGRILVDSALPAGNVISFNVYATDQGQTPGPKTSRVPAVVTVVFTVCPTTTTAAATTTTTTTTTRRVTAESEDNLPWIVIASLLGCFFLALLSYMLWRYGPSCCKGCDCRHWKLRRQRRQPTKPTEQNPQQRQPASRPISSEATQPEPLREPAGPATFWGAWKLHFLNDISKEGPEANRKPEPGDMRHVPDITYEPAEDESTATPSTTREPKEPNKRKCCAIL